MLLSEQEQITRTAPEDAPPGDGTKVSHVQAAVTVSGSPTPVPLPQEGPKTLPAILAPLAASTPSNKSRQAQITPVALVRFFSTKSAAGLRCANN